MRASSPVTAPRALRRSEADGSVCSGGNTGCLEAYFGGVTLSRDATADAKSLGRRHSSWAGTASALFFGE
ncbi:hypothetical protein ABZS81_22035 [Streptomyces sp. NPDC005318]|uniref:hypothetical protein n=1 Tax=Streptomyces sp. NPDC005318 TaxID=3157031 RepID=UPI0033B76056